MFMVVRAFFNSFFFKQADDSFAILSLCLCKVAFQGELGLLDCSAFGMIHIIDIHPELIGFIELQRIKTE